MYYSCFITVTTRYTNCGWYSSCYLLHFTVISLQHRVVDFDGMQNQVAYCFCFGKNYVYDVLFVAEPTYYNNTEMGRGDHTLMVGMLIFCILLFRLFYSVFYLDEKFFRFYFGCYILFYILFSYRIMRYVFSFLVFRYVQQLDWLKTINNCKISIRPVFINNMISL